MDFETYTARSIFLIIRYNTTLDFEVASFTVTLSSGVKK